MGESEKAPRGSWVRLPLVVGIMIVMTAAAAVVVRRIAIPQRPTHLILLVLDTVRADRVTPNGYSRDTTPFLAELARRGLLFTEAHSSAPWTLPSHASMFTGKRPGTHGCHWEHRWLVDSQATLAEVLAKQGFETVAMTTNPNVSTTFNLHQGFDTFDEIWRYRGTSPGVRDSTILQRRLGTWLDARDASRPFFLFLNLSDAHLPYDPPPEYRGRFGPISERARAAARNPELLRAVLSGEVELDDELRRGLSDAYDEELRALDDRVAQIVREFEERDLLRDSMLVITSDHGELLGEDGLVDHQLSMRDELLHVPLIVNFGERVAPARIRSPVILTSLFRWFLEAADGKTPAWDSSPSRQRFATVSEYFRPVDLVDALGDDGEPYDVRRSVVRHHGERRLEATARGAYELEDWQLFEGVGEERIQLDPADPMLSQLREFYRRVSMTMPFSELDSDLTGSEPLVGNLKELAAIGYVGPTKPMVPVHAVEHWSAGLRERGDGRLTRARLEFERALRVAPRELGLLLEYASVLDEAGSADALAAYDEYLDAASTQDSRENAQYRSAERRRRELFEQLDR